ncbi:membrane-associated phospholipid phosphatase [Parabacteroides sp. PF5-5]|nr:membrane-associated phospholipid phosphatase [Parabacteroides sp. PH5-39]MDH6316638.1 membrane-associated phospholipid phosphatase [Parabacteroides sp. PF5-13]MDH6320182.1 membrane-associated phospholipid phosphatase [Parabacteroides sp. PH5-13]MDH6323875.1 membrane-associated phospholipid phosphatase [Parabacteroides sp. PH5-8]MDH6327859.1 membrane-associated phospholipid phosphatase [Parabacteroides sp. PH5-41]MDH6335625.1 membrane-associated phospholipid phosphatase [Parabacteroides sp. 
MLRGVKCWIAFILFFLGNMFLSAQPIEVSQSRKNVRVSSDVSAAITPVACLVTTLALQDWEGLKQGAFAGVMTMGVSYALKYLISKDRPDRSDDHSFPSLHTSVSFTGAAFIQRRYGWKWGIPAYAVAAYTGWARTYAKKHDWWDVTAGAVLGVGSAYLFTRPFAQKHNLTISPMAGEKHFGIYASLCF